MKKKKIVFFVESLKCGGAEKSLLSLLNNLDAQKYDVDVLVIRKGGEFEQFLPEWITYKNLNLNYSLIGRIKFKLFNILNSNTHKAQLFWKSFHNEIKTYEESYDIAVGWGQGFATYFTAEKIKADRKFAWVNVDYDKAGYKFKYDRNIYKQFDKVIGPSEHVKKIMQKYIELEKVLNILDIIDEHEIKLQANNKTSINFNEKILSIVSVGRLAKPKAFDLSIETAKVLVENDVDFKWYIIGEGEERNYLESLIQEYHLNDHVILLGFRDNPYPYIKSSDIYVQTSKFEGLGRTLIEAAILHKPIVTTDFPTAYGLVEDGETGFITEMKAEKLAEKIQLLHADNHLYKSMVENLSLRTDNEKQKTLDKVYNLFDE